MDKSVNANFTVVKIFYLLLIIPLVLIAVGTSVYMNPGADGFNMILEPALLAAILLLGVMIFALFRILKFCSASIKRFKYAVIIISVLMLALQFVVLSGFDVRQTNDAYMINDQARSIAFGYESRVSADNVYFQIYGNNNFLLGATVVFYKLLLSFGINIGGNLPAAIVNLIALDLSIVIIITAICRMLDGVRARQYVLGFLALNTLNPFSYVLLWWTYSLIISLPIMATQLLLITFVEKSNGGKYKKYIYISLLAFTTALGLAIRPTAIFPLLAYLGYWCVFKRHSFNITSLKGVLLKAFIFAMVFVIVNMSIKLFSRRYVQESNRTFPVTHWIMMGLDSFGNVTPEDINYTNSFETTQLMKHGTVNEIKNRIGEFDVVDLAVHTVGKLQFTWADGTNFKNRLFTDVKFSPIYSYMCQERDDLLILYGQAFRAVTVLIALYAVVRRFKSGSATREHLILSLIVLGGIVFYLIWEAKSVYCVPFLPYLFLLLPNELYREAPCNILSKHRVMSFVGVAVLFAMLCIRVIPILNSHVDARKYVVRSECNDFWLYTDSINDVAKNDREVIQTFITDKPFSYVKISCDAIPNRDAVYNIQLTDRDGNVFAGRNVRSQDIVDGFITFKFDTQRPHSQQAYTINIKTARKNGGDSIKWYYKRSLATKQYDGECIVDNVKSPDLNLEILHRHSEEYCTALMKYIWIVLSATAVFGAMSIITGNYYKTEYCEESNNG